MRKLNSSSRFDDRRNNSSGKNIFNSNKKDTVTSKSSFGTVFTSKKGFGDVASTLIMFIAIIGVSVGMVIAIKSYAIDTQDAFEVQNTAVNNQLQTSIDIINVYYDDATNYTYVYLKNVGKTKLVTEDFDMFIDDAYITNFSVYAADNLSENLTLLTISSTAAFVKEYNLDAGSHSVKLISGYGGNGDTAYFNR